MKRTKCSLSFVLAEDWKETTWDSGTCNSPRKVWQSFMTRGNEWKKHDNKLVSVLDGKESFSLNLKRDPKKTASIKFLSVLRLLWYMQCSQSYFSQTQRTPECPVLFYQLSTLYLCGKLWFCMISSRSGCWYLTPCPLIGCFKFSHAWPPARHQLTLESATSEEISPGS